MNLEVVGKITGLLPEQSGQGKNGRWVKQEFIIETNDQYPKKICFSCWGDKVADIKKLGIGDVVTVSFNPESREFNGRWYTELRAWKIGKSSETDSQKQDIYQAPFEEKDIPEADTDDLPF